MPMALGHEAAGEVVELGEGVTAFEPGDHVVLAFVPACGEMRAVPGRPGRALRARRGGERRGHAAERRHPPAPRPTGGERDPPPPRRLRLLRSHRRLARRRPSRSIPSLPVRARGAVRLRRADRGRRRGQRRPDPARCRASPSSASAASASRRCSARCSREAGTIVAVDVMADKLELAKELGATHAVEAGPGAVAAIREITDGGAEHVIETVGSAAVLAEAYEATRRGGTTTTVGLPDPSQMLSIPAVSLVAEERTLRGSYLGSSVPARDLPALHRAASAGQARRRPAAHRTPSPSTRSTRASIAWRAARPSARPSSSTDRPLGARRAVSPSRAPS